MTWVLTIAFLVAAVFMTVEALVILVPHLTRVTAFQFVMYVNAAATMAVYAWRVGS